MEVGDLKYLLPLLWIFIACTCAIDVYFSIRLARTLPEMERNPIGRWLLHLDGGHAALLVSVKWLTNLLMLLILILSHRSNPRFCTVATYVIAGFQAALLAVLWS